MTLSRAEARQLAFIDRTLSRDATLRAVAGMFSGPVPRRTRRKEHAARLTLRSSRLVRALAVAAVAGLLCAVVAAPIDHPLLAALGVTAAVCAGLVFVVTVIHRGGPNEPLVPLLQRRSTRGGSWSPHLTAKETRHD